ncbi:hypothetical protein [Natronorubrum tibetense]|uniref:Uncharacterized protein n=1 Tax=Natronorubrum tibetense GA33 TaxID=1114856 RepID=L9VRV1_9EURY|nr:hypothetical protein [Natronorubrum tibetense]ELY39889.1 hypothetical protein C496_14466 [Natronorubrum tibetense GA33]
MIGNQPDDDRDQCTRNQTHPVTLEDVLALEEGDAIAVRTVIEERVEIFAGRVEADPPSLTAIENDLDEYSCAYLLPVDTNLWWMLEDDQIHDKYHELDELPPYRKAVGEPLTEPPSCSLDYREEEGVLFTLPSPVYNSRRVHHYARDWEYPVVALESGSLVEPENLIPGDYDGQ